MNQICYLIDRFFALSILIVLAVPFTGCRTSSPTVYERPPPRPAIPTSASEEQGDEGEFMIVDEMPQLIGGLARVQSQVVYPPSLIRAGIEGRVFVQFVVNVDGVPEDLVIVKSLHHELDEAALNAVAKARFEPGKKNGDPVAVKMSLPVTIRVPRSAR